MTNISTNRFIGDQLQVYKYFFRNLPSVLWERQRVIPHLQVTVSREQFNIYIKEQDQQPRKKQYVQETTAAP